MNFARQENHRVYFQRYLPPASTGLSPLSFASSSSHQNNNEDKEHRLVTSSAAIRLTAAATADHVTSLLRKKFGLEDTTTAPASTQSPSSPKNLKYFRNKSYPKNSKSKSKKLFKSRYFVGDALIIVGTLHHLPRQHLEYHHEERLRKRHLRQSRHSIAPSSSPSSSSSTQTTNNGAVSSTSMNGSSTTGDMNSMTSSNTMTSHSTMASHPNINNSTSNESFNSSNETPSNQPTKINQSNSSIDDKAENINIIRTLLPHENPLLVRDEMLAHLYQRQFEFQPQLQEPLQEPPQPNQSQTKTHSRLQKVEQMLQLQRQRGKKTGESSKPSISKNDTTPPNPSPSSSTNSNKKKHRPMGVNVSIRWFFQPNGGGKYDICSTERPKMSDISSSSDQSPSFFEETSPTVLNLDGYYSAMDESDESEVEDEDVSEESKDNPQGKSKHGKEGDNEGDNESNIPKEKDSRPLHLFHRDEWNSDEFYYQQFGSAPLLSRNVLSKLSLNEHRMDSSNETKNVLKNPIPSSPPIHQNLPSTESYSRYLSNEVKERYRLNMVQSPSSNNHCVSGFLMKRSTKDPNVWRRVYCTLSDDKFWFVSRIRPVPTSPSSTERSDRRFAKHHSIRLPHASISDPLNKLSVQHSNKKQQPKSRLSSSGPIHLIQISCQKGRTYTFCAYSRKAHKYWMKSVSTRIETCMENKWMEFAELFVEEEEDARTNRMKENAISHCWDRIIISNNSLCSNIKQHSEDEKENEFRTDDIFNAMVLGQKWYHHYSISGKTWWWKELIRLSMLVQEYREVCRHFVSFGRFFTAITDPIDKAAVERWRFHTRIQWEAAAAVCLSKCYSNMSLSGEENYENGNAFYHGDGGQLGEIGASIEDFVYNNLRNVNSKHVKDIVMVEAPPIDLFDSIMKKILSLETDENSMVEISVHEQNERLDETN